MTDAADPYADFSSLQPVAATDPYADFSSLADPPVAASASMEMTDPEGTGLENYGPDAAPDGHGWDRAAALARGTAHGLTLGTSDRIAAAGSALMGGDYGKSLKAQQDATAAAARDYPGAYTVGDIAGGLALPGGALKAVVSRPTLVGRLAASTGLGAGMGAAQELAASPDLTNVGDDAHRAGKGTFLGGMVGAALPGVAAGAGAAYRAAVGGVGLPEGINRAAASKLGEALAADQEGVARLPSLGPDAMLPDAGPSLLGLAQGVATKPGEGRTTLVNALGARNAGTNDRIQADIDAALGPVNSPLRVANNLKAVRAGVHNELPDIFENAPPVDVSPVLAFIGNRMNTAVGPEQAALVKARDYLMEQSPTGALVPVTNAEKVANAKSALQSMVDYGDPGIGVQPGALAKADGTTKRVLGSLNDRLRSQVPGYASVMDRSSALAKTIDALEEGQGVLGSGQNAVRPDDFSARLADASDAEKLALQTGVRADIDRTVGTKINDLQALKQDLQGDGGWNEQKIASLFGQQPAADLAASVDRNQLFRNTFGKVVENSQTAQRTAASQALDTAASSEPIIPKNATVTGFALNRAENILRMIADGRADFEGKKTRAAIGRVLAMPASDVREQQLSQLLGRSFIQDQSGKRIGNAAALLSGAAGLAELRRRSMAGTQ